MKKTYLFTLFALCLCAEAGVAQYNVILNFTGTNGSKPTGDLIIANNVLYGMTVKGGAGPDSGCIFSIHTDGTGYVDLYDFRGSTGGLPQGSLTRSGKTLFGMTQYGGAHSNSGSIFSIDTNGHNYRDLIDFNGANAPMGADAWGSLTLSPSGDTLYGMTSRGGSAVEGNIFRVDTSGSGFTNLYLFSLATGDIPDENLVLSGGLLFGTTYQGGMGGSGGLGVIFSVHTDGTDYKVLHYFSGVDGANPGSLMLSGDKLFGMNFIGGTNGEGNIFTIDTTGANFKDLYDLYSTSGDYPNGSLILLNKTLYGMMVQGGANTVGDIFSVDTDGTGLRVLKSFSAADGDSPQGSLIFSGSTLYGMTETGGTSSMGVVFGFDTTNSITTVNNARFSTDRISLYPNPNNGEFTIQLSVVRGQLSVEIYDVLGEKVLTETLRSAQGDNSIDLTNQPNGIYLYRVIGENGTLVGEGKVVVER